MKRQSNHVKLYELSFEKPTEFNREALLKLMLDGIEKEHSTDMHSGTYYLKEHKSYQYADVFLFGKDNEDASNYKRKRKKLKFEKLDIQEDEEVLTDFIHIAISKKKHKRKSKDIYKVFLEKSSLIRAKNFEDFIDHLTEDAFLTYLDRIVVKDFYDAVINANRIMQISEIIQDEGVPLPANQLKDIDTEDLVISKSYSISSGKRGGSVPTKIFDAMFNKIGKTKEKSHLVVRVKDSGNNDLTLDFNKNNSSLSVKYDIEINAKIDTIQEDIAKDMNKLINLVDKGKI